MNKIEYRIVEWYNEFFSAWCYKLETKQHWKFLWWSGYYWEECAGNSLTRYIPDEWELLNIIEHITEEIGDSKHRQ